MSRARFGARLVLAAMGVAAALLWNPTRIGERRVLLRLPAGERAALYGRELATFRELCIMRGAEELDQRCRDRAQFLLGFPECDSSCRALTARVIYATR